MWPFTKNLSIAEMNQPLERKELLQRGRIAILDDETPEMLEDLKAQGLAIDHLPSTKHQNFAKLEEPFYDVLLLDYAGIGQNFGDEGLDVLRHLKRVNPALRIIAFTAKTFDASKADFFRECHGLIKKDSGIRKT